VGNSINTMLCRLLCVSSMFHATENQKVRSADELTQNRDYRVHFKPKSTGSDGVPESGSDEITAILRVCVEGGRGEL
jgi:hypothetical protein